VPEEAEPGLSAVAVNSPDPTGPALMFTATEWAAFTTGVRDGEFHSSTGTGRPHLLIGWGRPAFPAAL
jgi:Domain of unknown function (DUF397)